MEDAVGKMKVCLTFPRDEDLTFCVSTLTEGGASISSVTREHSKTAPPKRGNLWSRTTHQTIRAHLAPGVGIHLAVRDAGYQALTMQTRLKLGHMVGHLN